MLIAIPIDAKENSYYPSSLLFDRSSLERRPVSNQLGWMIQDTRITCESMITPDTSTGVDRAIVAHSDMLARLHSDRRVRLSLYSIP